MPIAPPFDIGSFIEVDDSWHDGWPYVRGTKKTVASVSVLYNEGSSAERIAEEKYMELPQVYAALCYYLANRDEIDHAIESHDARTDARAQAAPTRRRD